MQGRDLLGLAQTGTGKTATYILPILQNLDNGSRSTTRALILVPTRELAEQVQDNIQQLSFKTKLRSCAIYGGVSKNSQIQNIRRGVDIVVACPGRLLDHINSRTIDLSTIEVLILDEADQMCDKGFLPDIRRILKQIPDKRQSMVFSATMPKELRHVVEEMLSKPVTVQVDHDKPAATISHRVYHIAQTRKTSLLKQILQNKEISTCLVFTRTKHKAKSLGRQLQQSGFRATSLQGNLSQNQRKLAMDGFRSGEFNILVATDIAARGIDVSDISHVINYDVPDTVEAYTHRAGRTGRAKKSGQALTFAAPENIKIVRMVESSLGIKFSQEKVDGFEEVQREMTAPSRPQNPRAKTSQKKGAAPKSSGPAPGSRTKRRSKAKFRATSFDFGLSSN